MKKRYKLLIGLGVLVVALGATYHLVNTAPTLSTPSARVAAIMEDGQCLMCHSEGAELPFYANYPVIGTMMRENIANGSKIIDLTDAYEKISRGEKVEKVDLNKIEYAISNDMMPMAEFNIIHWGAAINSTEKEMILEWIAQQRKEYYSNGLSHADFANEPIQPVNMIDGLDSAKIALGFKLFHDTRLSTDNTLSCASCHGLETGGVDNDQFSTGVRGQLGGVNAPTIYNAVFNKTQFWDGRAATLALQAAGPPMNPIEMGCASWDEIIGKLKDDKALTAAFTASYPEGYSGEAITDAIAEFEKTLTTPDCPFDLYLKGNKGAITESQKRGYEQFKANSCATCHAGVNIGGQSFELMGVKADYFADRGTELTNEDNGRFKETANERDKHRFKVPTLRNLTLTAPYYHDGTVKTIDRAVDMMMQYQVGKTLDAQQHADMVAFLESLTAPSIAAK